ncbi:putative DIC1-mitochondrial dicarboxylate carrier protein [Ceraceosorus guamensis]|uniref:Putative DIC1-mitochondrial dicarboxylate carrier protein n=1 Tax=Ceraceosorus guamensis TaxID=1522189 RepID=A0A316W881_9BASI|nr:putative DIC1-mitochondrial dicarboxylate carrier protein [Ceraceosorus guamensis]PWN46042.1 putative DIC1-mitochondrial dicarboxylate carrier protein [Ceraceosorus guamensis]
MASPASSSVASAQRRPKPPAYPFYLGGVAACLASFVTHPLDCVKNRMQTAKAKQGMWDALKGTAKHDGISGLYAGLTASLLRQMTYSVTRFGAYDWLKVELRTPSDGPPSKPLPAWKLAACASIAGAAGGVAGNPADIILVRMTSDLNRPPAERYNYKHALHGVYRMTVTEGPVSLFRGIVPNVTRAVLMNASQLATYDFFKHSLLNTGLYKEGTWLHFSASFLAGTVATTVCSPADVIKARVMSANGASGGTIAKLQRAIQKEGIGFLFRGWTPAWVRLSPNTILIFVILEKLRLMVDVAREQQGLPSQRNPGIPDVSGSAEQDNKRS